MMVFETCLGAWRGRGREGGRDRHGGDGERDGENESREREIVLQ